MSVAAAPKVAPSMSDAAVKAKTGKTWRQWFTLLDRAGGRAMTHKEIVAWLVKNHAVRPWWQQMVTVTYEQARGLREKHQTAGGYQVSCSKTFNESVGRLFRAWKEPEIRERWLEDPGFELRKATKDKSMRITWVDGKTSVELNFYVKGNTKTQVVVQHSKLGSGQAAQRMKAYWAKQFVRLQGLLEE
jgi:hypothetical protein